MFGGPLGRRAIEQLEVDHALAAVAERRADAVGAGVAAADDDHVVALGREVMAVVEVVVEQALGVARQEIHREVDALQVAAGAAAGRVERLGRAGGQQHGVVFVEQLVAGR